MSSPFVNDTFTDTAGVSLESHIGETGATWSKNAAAGAQAQITASGTLRLAAAGAVSVYTASGAPTSADYDVVATLSVKSLRINDYAGVVGRVVLGPGLNLYGAVYQHGTGYYLYKQVSSALTILGTVDPVAVADGDVLTLQLRGTTLNLLVNGTQVATATDSTFSAAGSVGTFLYADSATSDTAGVHLNQISATLAGATTPPAALSAGTLAVAAGDPPSSALAVSAATASAGGTSPYTTRLDRSFDGGATWHALDNGGTIPYADTGLPRSTALSYRATVTDAAGAAAVTPVVTATTAAATGSPTTLVVCGIDSITHGYGASTDQTPNSAVGLTTGSTYPARLTALLGDGVDIRNVGIDGQDIPTAMAANREAAFVNPTQYTAGQVFVYFGGINDLRSGVTAATVYARDQAYVAQLKSLGYRVVLCTLHDVIDPASSFTTAAKAALNSLRRAGWQYDLKADALADVGTDARIGVDGAASRAGYANYYATLDLPKREHLNDRGYELLASIVATAVAQALNNVTFVDPGPSNVRQGVSFGNAEVGTYAGDGGAPGVLGGLGGRAGFFGL